MSLPYYDGREMTLDQALAWYNEPDQLAHFSRVDSTTKQILFAHLIQAGYNGAPPRALDTTGVPFAGFEYIDYSAPVRSPAVQATTPPIVHTAADMGASLAPPALPSMAVVPTISPSLSPMMSLSSGGFRSAIGSLSPSIYQTLGYTSMPTVGGTSAPPPITVGGVAGDICTQYGIPASVCALGASAIDRWLGGTGGSSTAGTGGTTSGASRPFVACEPGYVVGPDGTCVIDPGWTQARTSAGLTQGVPGTMGTAVIGAWGMPAVAPSVVGNITGARGTSPILKCPPRMVLGADNLCYMKPLAARYRKWKPAPKPPVSAEDARAIRQAAAAKKRVRKLAGSVGLSTSPRGSRRFR